MGIRINNARNQRGVAALAVTLILGGIIVELGLSGLLAVTFLNSENFGVRLSAQALANAQSGFEEAFLRVIRYKNLPNNNSGWNKFPLSTALFGGFSLGNDAANTIVCQKNQISVSVNMNPSGNILNCAVNPLPGGGGVYEVISQGFAFTKRRQINGSVAVDPVTGVATLQSLKEVPYGTN